MDENKKSINMNFSGLRIGIEDRKEAEEFHVRNKTKSERAMRGMVFGDFAPLIELLRSQDEPLCSDVRHILAEFLEPENSFGKSLALRKHSKYPKKTNSPLDTLIAEKAGLEIYFTFREFRLDGRGFDGSLSATADAYDISYDKAKRARERARGFLLEAFDNPAYQALLDGISKDEII